MKGNDDLGVESAGRQADKKVISKSVSFCKIKLLNVQHSELAGQGQLGNCNAITHSQCI